MWQSIKTKSQKVFGANSYVCRSYRGITGRCVCVCVEVVGLPLSPFWIGLKQHSAGYFLRQHFLESLGQHCIEFWPEQCCPKSIKATLHSTFWCALLAGTARITLLRVSTCSMLFGVSWAILHWVLSVQYCHKSISWDNIAREKPYVVLLLRLQTTLHQQKFY